MTEELKELLSEDGSRVYKEVEKALQGGNARTKSAASVGAALLAAHAATWAERVSRATGKPFTAQDYMKSVTIDADGTVHEGALNALRSGVDLDERVPVLDIDAMDNRLRGMTNQQAAAFIAQLAQQSPILTLDALANVGISSRPYGKRHVVHNKATDRRKNLVATGKVLTNMEDFIKSSVVIEIAPNRKAGRNLSGMSDGQKRAQHHKNTVNAYYYIMLPVKHNNQLNTLVLIAEERNGCLVGETAQVELYQIQYANKERDPALMPTQHRVSINTRQHAPATVSIREMLAGVKTSDGNFYYQQAWHGAAKKFDAFSLDYVGTGDGGSAHAHGLYFAKERSFAESYRGEDGALLEVEIPDDEYLLKENAYFKEQSPFVQQALREIAEGWGEVERGEKSVEEALAGKSGRDLYFKVMEEVGEFARKEKCMRDDGTFFYICSDPLEGTEARVSEHFSKHGVKGVSFTDYGDPGFVIFDPHDAEILARYQESLGQIQGQFSVLQEGSRLVSLFEAADESTFLHETAHIFYDDLARLAPFDEETAEDLAEVDAWASWYEGAAKEYEDTPWAMEFAARERAIREAIRTHNEALEGRLKAEWREERFARGFERYLEEGRAPTSTLQKVFDKCRTFVKTAYAAFRGGTSGGRPSPAVEKVMAKLITPVQKERKGVRDEPIRKAKTEEDFVQIKHTTDERKESKMKHTKRDVYTETTEKIVELLETGQIPWQRGWDGKIGAQLVGLPINGKTNRPYTRLNKMFLSMVMAEKESDDPRFFTMAMLWQQNKIHQEKVELMKATGKKYPVELEWEYRVKKGSHGYAVFSHWKVDRDRHGNLLPPEDQYWAKKQTVVFHAADCIRREYKLDKDGSRLLDEDGKPIYEDHPLKEWKPKSKGYTHEEQSEICEAILAASGAKILHDIPRYSDTPCYSSKSDIIHLLPKEAYKDINEYYATALHELCHWTGHKSRMDRELVGERENKELYAKEELRAELASTFLAIDLGIPMNTTNHAAYVQSWVRALKDDKKEIFKASNEAVQIANYVKRFMPERCREKDETLVSAPEGVIVDAEPQVPAAEEAPVQPTEEGQSIGDHLTPVDDPSLRTLSLSTQAKETTRLYRYFVERVTSLVGSIPTDNLHSIEKHAADAPYKGGDAIYFEKQLPASVVAKCSMTPDYRYFANKSVHIEIYRQKDDASLAASSPPFFDRDYEKSFEGNYVRTAASSQEMCAKVFSELSQASNDEATVPRPIREGDLIEVDGQLWNVDKAGFTRVQLHPYEDDLVITPLELPEVKEMLAQVEKTVNSESYAVYRQIFRENSYIGAQADGTIAVHPGAFKATDDAKEGIELEMQKDYARNFRENTFKEGLSIYTPTDEKGWQKLDEDFAARFLIDTLRNGKYDDGRVDADLLKENIYDFVGKAIQENSPYSVISQDAGYGYDRAVAAFSRREVSDAFEEHQRRTAGRFAEQEKIASQSAPPEEKEEDAGRGR